MNAEVVKDLITIVLAIIVGICGTTVYTERKSARDLRDRVSDGLQDNGKLEDSKQRFESTIAEIRKNQQVAERCSNCGNNCNCSSNTNHSILNNKEPLNE